MTREELRSAGFPVEDGAYQRLAEFVDLLLDENRRVNLTAIRSAPEVWRLHICDSLAAVPLLRETTPAKILDLGTGGGVPGIPLACAVPAAAFTLIDATRKKTAAVERMATKLGFDNLRVVWGRAEVLAQDPSLRHAFTVVIARAVAPVRDLAVYAAPFLQAGGKALFYKTLDFADELAAAENALPALGLRYSAARHYRLPGDMRERVLLVLEKGR